jgi:hypothetical protein
MPTIDLVVEFNLVKQTTGVTTKNLNIALLFAKASTSLPTWTTRTRRYTSLESVASDFASSTDEYKALEKIFSQQLKPSSVVVGRRDTPVPTDKTITFSRPLIATEVINGTVNGVALTPTTFITDMATTLNAVATKILTIVGIDSVAVVGNTLQIVSLLDYPLSLDSFAVTNNVTPITAVVSTNVGGRSIVDDYNAVQNEVNDFYGIAMVDYNVGAVESLARRIQPEFKMLFTSFDTVGIKDQSVSNDIASKLKQASLGRTTMLWHHIPSEYSHCAKMGLVLGYPCGQAQYNYKTLAGVTVSKINDTELSALANKYVNAYIEMGGRNIIYGDLTFDKNAINTIKDLDYLVIKTQENLFTMFVNTPKIPYTQDGIDSILANISSTLIQMEKEGIIQTYTIKQILAKDVPQADKLNRILNNIELTLQIQGSIIKVVMNGIATV